MHPAEKELINGTLDQMESCCRTLRRYLAFAARTEQAPIPTSTEPDFPLEPEEAEDQKLEAMLGKMMGLPGFGGKPNVS